MIFVDRKYHVARVWSNSVLRGIAPHFKGTIVNISGWDDRDKEGGSYRSYFVNATEYAITNYLGDYGAQGTTGEIGLDLTADLPVELQGRYDHVFNHTTLEHIFDIRKAFANICSIAKESVILTVPFSQIQHETGSFKDYWRLTPTCIRELFKENGFSVVYEETNNHKNAAVYVVSVAVRNVDIYSSVFPGRPPIQRAGKQIGKNVLNEFVEYALRILGYKDHKN